MDVSLLRENASKMLPRMVITATRDTILGKTDQQNINWVSNMAVELPMGFL